MGILPTTPHLAAIHPPRHPAHCQIAHLRHYHPMSLTNPFRRHPRALAHLPSIVRLYILNVLIGFALSAVFTGLILSFDVAGLKHLVTHVQGGGLAVLMLFTFNGIVFAGVQTAIVIWSMSYDRDDGPRKGRSVRLAPALASLPARVDTQRQT